MPKNTRLRGLARLCGAGALPLLTLFAMPSPASAGIQAVRIASGFTLPLYVGSAPGDNTRLFIAEQSGRVKIINLPSGTVNPTPFLDISGEVAQNQGGGILGMCFDPDYATNGRFYVSYTTASGGVFGAGVSHVARFNVTSDPAIADPASEVTVITVDQTQTDHNVDWIGFSPRKNDDHNLYIASGDGGHIEDNGPGHPPGGNGQSLQTLLGKMLRIHVQDDGSYTIPKNNPFFGSTTNKQEIFEYGLRNPFRDSFDRRTGTFFIGDVGETEREEIDVNATTNPGGGENWGWRPREGFIQNHRYPDEVAPGAVDPVLDYTHEDTGICVIGGYMYRGKAVKDFKGLYVFGDCFGPETGDFTGRVFTMIYQNGVASAFTDITSELFPTAIGGYDVGALTTFGEDNNGELYMADTTGQIFQIKSAR